MLENTFDDSNVDKNEKEKWMILDEQNGFHTVRLT